MSFTRQGLFCPKKQRGKKQNSGGSVLRRHLIRRVSSVFSSCHNVFPNKAGFAIVHRHPPYCGPPLTTRRVFVYFAATPYLALSTLQYSTVQYSAVQYFKQARPRTRTPAAAYSTTMPRVAESRCEIPQLTPDPQGSTDHKCRKCGGKLHGVSCYLCQAKLAWMCARSRTTNTRQTERFELMNQ